MFKCNCGKEYLSQRSLNSHAGHCDEYERKEKTKYKVNDEYVCECGKIFTNAQSLNAHFSHCLIHRNGKPALSRVGTNTGWSKGKTKDDCESLKMGGLKHSKRISDGEIIPAFLNKHHTNETKERISKSALENNNGYHHCKYYEIFCPYENKIIKVQGTYEKRYAEYLNENAISWVRSKQINLKYRLSDTDYEHTYYPDFYLPDSNEYIEIKGRWWISNDGRVDDRRKMNNVIEQNKDKTIKILLFDDLRKLNIL